MMLVAALAILVPTLLTSSTLAPPTAARPIPIAAGSGRDLPAFSGKVERFTLSPRGDIDGVILADGSEIKTPPHLSARVATVVQVGDEVTVWGLRAAALPLIEAAAIANLTRGTGVVDLTPQTTLRPPPVPPGPGSGVPVTMQGGIRMLLHGPRGDLNGVLLADGTIVRVPPPEAQRLKDTLQPGRTITVTGPAVATPYGRVIDARLVAGLPS